MSKSSNKVGMLTSNRGRVVKKIIWAVVVGLFLFMIFNPGGKNSSTSNATTDAGWAESAVDNREAVAPIANPFAQQALGASEGINVGDLGTSVSEVAAGSEQARKLIRDSKTQNGGSSSSSEGSVIQTSEILNAQALEKIDGYQNLSSEVQKFIVAYGTYNPQSQTPQQWADSLVGASEKVKVDALTHANSTWVNLKGRQISSVATIDGQSLKPVYASLNLNTVQVSIGATKRVTTAGETTSEYSSYMVTVKKVNGVWQVTSVRGG